MLPGYAACQFNGEFGPLVLFMHLDEFLSIVYRLNGGEICEYGKLFYNIYSSVMCLSRGIHLAGSHGYTCSRHGWIAP